MSLQLSDPYLSALGVQVRSVSAVERQVVAAAESAAVEDERRDFEERDANFAAEIAALLEALRTKQSDAPPNAEIRLLRRRIAQLEQRRGELKEAHRARVDIARAAPLAQKSVERNSQVPTDAALASEVVEGVSGPLEHETQREFNIRTGKVTPFQDATLESIFKRRPRQRTTEAYVTGKRARARQTVAGPSDAESSDEEDADSCPEKDVDWEVDGGGAGESTDSQGPAPEAEIDMDEEVVFEGGLCVPAALFDRLYDYQKTGLQWLWELHSQQCGGILADEMGLGKTVQVVVFLAALQYSGKLPGPVIVVAPATVLQQWAREFGTWGPAFYVRILHHAAASLETARKRRRPHSRAAGNSLDARHVVHDVAKSVRPSVLITSYEQVRKHQDLLADKFEYIVLDEGHKIRNPDAEITLACKRFQTPRRLLVTGTPLQNSLKELWTLFDFVFPGRLGTLVVFEAQFSAPIALGGYVNATKSQVYTAHRCAVVLRDLISPYLLRRLKRDVSIQLPEKQEHILFCRLTAEQREAYKAFLASKTVRQVMAGRTNLLCAITMLRKICNHVDIATASPQWDGPRWSSSSSSKPLAGPEMREDGTMEEDSDALPEIDAEFGNWRRSGKMQVLNTVLRTWQTSGSRALLFSQTRTMLNILEAFAKEHGFSYRRMDGQTAVASRMQLIDEFNEDPDIFLFLLTTKVGGIGVNLTGADRVLLYDPDWNPSTDLQARERAWRIGQKRSVLVYRLVTSGTIEEKIYHRQIYKQFLTDKVLSDARQRRFFKRKDIRDLFSLGDDQEEGTETGDLFAGTHVQEVVKPLDKAQDADRGEGTAVGGDARLLKELFEDPAAACGLHSAIDHDKILDAGNSSSDLGLMRYEAEKIAAKAVAEIQRSSRERRRDNVGVPTWTGRSGLAGVPRLQSSASETAPSKAGTLLQKMRERHQVASSVPSAASTVDEHANLMQLIIQFLRAGGGSAGSEALVEQFGDRVEKNGQGLLVFKAMLKKVAVLKRDSGLEGAIWVLRPAYSSSNSPP
jgi:DNA excision repair protein ERCC-6